MEQEYTSGLSRVGFKDTFEGDPTWITDPISADSTIDYTVNEVETTTGVVFGGRTLDVDLTFLGSTWLNQLRQYMYTTKPKYIQFQFSDGRIYITQKPVNLIVTENLQTDSRQGVHSYNVTFLNIRKRPLILFVKSLSFDIDTTLGNGVESFYLPVRGQNLRIKWGDDSVSAIDNDDEGAFFDPIYKVYDNGGTFRIEVQGLIKEFNFSQVDNTVRTSNNAKVIGGADNTWGNLELSGSVRFSECINYTPQYKEPFNILSFGFNGMQGMFYNCTSFNTDISNWDTTGVRDMTGMFQGASSFNRDISVWNTSSLRGANNMFDGAISFNQPIGAWDMSSYVSSAEAMFRDATAFNKDLHGWTGFAPNKIDYMFQDASSFNGRVDGWNLINIISGLEGMFWGASSFNGDLNTWDVSEISILKSTFRDASQFNGNVDNWAVGNVVNFERTFQGATLFNRDIGNWDVSSALTLNNMLRGAQMFDKDLGAWNIQTSDCAGMLSYSGMSVENMSKSIIGWANRANKTGIAQNVTMGVTNLSYNDATYTDAYLANTAGAFTDAASAKTYLENTHGWTFSGTFTFVSV